MKIFNVFLTIQNKKNIAQEMAKKNKINCYNYLERRKILSCHFTMIFTLMFNLKMVLKKATDQRPLW